MDLDSLTPTDHARRYAILLAACLGTFVFIACWMAASMFFVWAAATGVLASVAAFFPLRAVMRLVVAPPRTKRPRPH